jgi:anthranilate/para-aminobenzoate synthase component I
MIVDLLRNDLGKVSGGFVGPISIS